MCMCILTSIMCIYIYIYVLEYGVRVRAPVSTEIYWSKREKTVFHEYLQEACVVLTEISENLQKPPGVYVRM